jgi:hypothetical protein
MHFTRRVVINSTLIICAAVAAAALDRIPLVFVVGLILGLPLLFSMLALRRPQ